jgi:hypothetical protein
MKIFYGIRYPASVLDITDICISKKTNENTIFIPSDDHRRTEIFTDPYVYFVKKIFIINNDILVAYDIFHEITINLQDNTIVAFNVKDTDSRLSSIPSKINFSYGCLLDELPEQKMVIRCSSGNENVLEIGSNVGRNSLVIASILQNQNNFLTIESDKYTTEQLIYNRNKNNFSFHIENSALSKRKLIKQGWSPIPSDILLDGYNWVNTINFVDLQNKYQIEFDTLVLDCGGAFYYILILN